MIRRLFLTTFYSIIVFCLVSFVSVMTSLLSNVGNPSQKPTTNIGFPCKYYYQFWCSGADSPNCGWQFGNFVLDCFITWIVTVAIYLVVQKSKRTANLKK
ncbi:MAG: hypothetical protein JWO44_675 [Bacteroidetes bacterium]|nr:hypothetical protein [Bacteroidota bacterium]